MSKDHGTVNWTELHTRDAEGAKAFYAAVCGWTYDTMPSPDGGPDYIMCVQGDTAVAGIMDITNMPHKANIPSNWFTYMTVGDLGAAMKAATGNGGKEIRPPFEVPNVGHIAIVQDTTGATLGLIQPS